MNKKIDFKNGDIVYGCAFDIDFDRNHLFENDKVTNLLCKPVKGIILNNKFYILKKDGTPRNSGGVSVSARKYAETYEESVEIYNQLIQSKIDKFRFIANNLETEKII